MGLATRSRGPPGVLVHRRAVLPTVRDNQTPPTESAQRDGAKSDRAGPPTRLLTQSGAGVTHPGAEAIFSRRPEVLLLTLVALSARFAFYAVVRASATFDRQRGRALPTVRERGFDDAFPRSFEEGVDCEGRHTRLSII